MFVRGLTVCALGALLSLLPVAAHAQDAIATQKAISLGGSDARGLPDPDTLPPPFGSTLFGAGRSADIAPARRRGRRQPAHADGAGPHQFRSRLCGAAG